MRDLWQEIMISMRTNRMRTFLTGFSIAWGIFMLIVLLASGNGLKNAMEVNFSYMSKNSVTLWAGSTDLPYKGYKRNRRIRFNQNDVEYFRKHLPNIDEYSPVVNKWGQSVSYDNLQINSELNGVVPSYGKMRSFDMVEGRFINEHDMKERAKVVVLHKESAESLVKGKSALGEYVRIGDISFKVIGICKEVGGYRNPPFYIPYSTANTIYNPSGEIYNISFTVKGVDTEEQERAYTRELRRIVSNRMVYDPNDRNAVYINNRSQDYRQTQQIFGGISLFIWIIGIGTLIAGVVGISNIMLITVKERTREFGIRKALGATPGSILLLVIMESIFITTLFGYIGMLLGVGLTELVSMALPQGAGGGEDMVMFKDPTVDMGVIFAATMVLVIAGVIAGYIPARKAAKIKPIEAMQAK